MMNSTYYLLQNEAVGQNDFLYKKFWKFKSRPSLQFLAWRVIKKIEWQ